ncbi:MAG: hypothetical protein HC902_04555 [Calothrix sp. SM1_5_4]|nr:hypothetical protein [Calothrix sp. SM1_5_4]
MTDLSGMIRWNANFVRGLAESVLTRAKVIRTSLGGVAPSSAVEVKKSATPASRGMNKTNKTKKAKKTTKAAKAKKVNRLVKTARAGARKSKSAKKSGPTKKAVTKKTVTKRSGRRPRNEF